MTPESVPPPYEEDLGGESSPAQTSKKKKKKKKGATSGSPIPTSSATRTFLNLRLPTGVKPSNFVCATRANELCGVWVIDPSMPMPVNVFPSAQSASGHPGQETTTARSPNVNRRNNLELQTTKEGAQLFADAFILPAEKKSEFSASDTQARTFIALDARGQLTLRLHDASPNVKNEDRLPVVVTAASHNWKTDLYLPKTFCGPLNLKARKGVWYSSSVKAHLTPLSENDGNHVAFLGEFEPNCWNGWDSWGGDSVIADGGKSSINVYFDDEGTIPTSGDTGCICM